MRVARAVLVLSSVCCSLGADTPTKDDGKGLKGDWTIVSVTIGDRSAPADMVKGLTTSFDERAYTNRSHNEVVEQGTYRLDTEKSPWTIDFAVTKGPEAGKRQLGLVALDGKTLTLCVADAGSPRRPTSLEPKADSQATVVVMKRSLP